MVWLSRFARFAPGKSIRGGVPVCWPWFGPHATDPGLPAHGFARTVPWEVTATRELDNGASEIALALVETDQTRAMWPHRAGVSMRVTVGATLEIALTTQNRGRMISSSARPCTPISRLVISPTSASGGWKVANISTRPVAAACAGVRTDRWFFPQRPTGFI